MKNCTTQYPDIQDPKFKEKMQTILDLAALRVSADCNKIRLAKRGPIDVEAEKRWKAQEREYIRVSGGSA